MFGDFFSYSSSDTNNCAIVARNSENTPLFINSTTVTTSLTGVAEGFGLLSLANATVLSNTLPGHYCAGTFSNIGGSVQFGKHSDQTKMGAGAAATVMQMGYLGSYTNGAGASGSTWSTGFNYPNATDGGLYIAPVWIHHNGIVRGYFRGLWCPLHHLPLGHTDTYSGTANLNGKSFIAMNTLGASNWNNSSNTVPTPVQCHVEYSDTWS
jgi:hypothetical protein